MENKVVVIKLNGGLGTTLCCEKAKCLIEISKDKTLLDLILERISKFSIYFLCSDFTYEDTKFEVGKKYQDLNVNYIMQDMQTRQLDQNEICSLAENKLYYPGGHGKLYEILYKKGFLDKFISEGKEVIHISNIDNFKAVPDENIVNLVSKEKDLCIDVIEYDSKQNKKGGVFVKKDNVWKLCELSQEKHDFNENLMFNTNNIYINIKSLKKLFETTNHYNLDFIENRKIIDGVKIIQREVACGSIVKYFPDVHFNKIDRCDFVAIKTKDDLEMFKNHEF